MLVSLKAFRAFTRFWDSFIGKIYDYLCGVVGLEIAKGSAKIEHV